VGQNFSAYSSWVTVMFRSAADLRFGGGRVQFHRALAPLGTRDPGDIYFRLNPGHDAESLMNIYEQRYRGEPFIRLYEPGQVPDLRPIQRTNYCDIGVKVEAEDGGRWWSV